MRYSSFILVICLLFDVGCTSVPSNQHSPAIKVPKQWPHASSAQSYDLKSMQWWQSYHQPELNTLIENALQRNNDIQLAMTNIDYAKSQLDEIKLSWLPGGTLMGGISQFPILANPGGFVLAAPLYVVNIFQQYKQQQSARQQLMATFYAKECTKLMIISAISVSYFTLLAEQESAELYRQLLKDQRDYLNLSKTQYQFGLIAEDDLMLIETDLEQTKVHLEMVLHNIVLSKNTLHYLLNENPGHFEINGSFGTLNTNAIIPGNTPVSVLNNRPDIHQNKALLEAAFANVGASIGNLLPSITVGAYLGTGTTSHGPIKLLEAYPSIPVDLPMYAQIKMSKAQFRTLTIRYVDGIKAALRDVDNDLSAYQTRTRQLHHFNQAVIDTQKHCGWVNARFKHGIEDEVELKRCQTRLDKLKLLTNQSKLAKMLSVVKLYQDLGGGYAS